MEIEHQRKQNHNESKVNSTRSKADLRQMLKTNSERYATAIPKEWADGGGRKCHKVVYGYMQCLFKNAAGAPCPIPQRHRKAYARRLPPHQSPVSPSASPLLADCTPRTVATSCDKSKLIHMHEKIIGAAIVRRRARLPERLWAAAAAHTATLLQRNRRDPADIRAAAPRWQRRYCTRF